MLRLSIVPPPEDDAVPYRNLTRHYAAPINGHIAGVWVRCSVCLIGDRINSTFLNRKQKFVCGSCRREP